MKGNRNSEVTNDQSDLPPLIYIHATAATKP